MEGGREGEKEVEGFYFRMIIMVEEIRGRMSGWLLASSAVLCCNMLFGVCR